jgi:hypothetical protein
MQEQFREKKLDNQRRQIIAAAGDRPTFFGTIM